jgi:hypothetical protein
MPFGCQLKLPTYNGVDVEAKLLSWELDSPAMVKSGDVIAYIEVNGEHHALCVTFPCYVTKYSRLGAEFKTGDLIATCGADGESIPYGRDYLVIR